MTYFFIPSYMNWHFQLFISFGFASMSFCILAEPSSNLALYNGQCNSHTAFHIGLSMKLKSQSLINHVTPKDIEGLNMKYLLYIYIK